MKNNSLSIFLLMFICISPIFANEQITIEVLGNKLELVRCSSGEFIMGSPVDEFGRSKTNEQPQHKILIDRDFYIGKYEITQKLYEAVTYSNPSKNIGKNNPVERVTYYDAMYFCQLLNQVTEKTRPNGYFFTLPSEKQWEYACRAGKKTALSNGKSLSGLKGNVDELNDIAWYKANSNLSTQPVGTKNPNYWGIYDMHGNVAEWCLDSFNGNEIANEVSNNSKCIIRGGAYFYEPEKLRSASRGANSPDSVSSGFGFRVALVKKDSVVTPKIDFSDKVQKNIKPITEAKIKDNSSDIDSLEYKLPSADVVITKIENSSESQIASNSIEVKSSQEGKTQELASESIKLSNVQEIKEQKTVKKLDIKVGDKISISINGVKFPLIGCPAGEYVMGSPINEVGRKNNEDEKKIKIINDFYIGKYEITQGQYKAITGNNPSKQVGDRLPVHNINYLDAVNFCKKLNELTIDKRPDNYIFAIPSEEEWEYACRSGYLTSLNNGKNLKEADSSDEELNKLCWYALNSLDKIQTVGKRTANAWGIHDMLGNVWELCDKYDAKNTSLKVVRGGSFKTKASECRNASRTEIESNKTEEDFGFRIILKFVE